VISEVAAKALEKDEDNEAADRIRARKNELRLQLAAMIEDDVGAPSQVADMFSNEGYGYEPWWP
jgi:hypothetical protein